MGRVECLICGDEFKAITNTHLKQHRLTLDQYITMFDLDKTDWQSKKQMEAADVSKAYNVDCMNKAHRKLIKNGKAYVQSETFKVNNSKRMIENNPMFDPEVAAKVGITMHEKYKHEVHPNTGGTNPGASKHMKLHNPMFDPVCAFLAQAKGRQTLRKNGNVSTGQKLLYKIMDGISSISNISYKKEYYLLGYFLDIAILSIKVAIEYDGHRRHYENNGEFDVKRDKILCNQGWRILRIDTDAMFSNRIANDIWQFINYSTEVRTCLGKKYNQFNL